MSPLRNAVSFVDNNQTHAWLRARAAMPVKRFQQCRFGELLGCHEHNRARCGVQLFIRLPFLGGAQCAVDLHRLHVSGEQLVALILHQCDQWRYDEGQAAQMHGGQLVAQRFASTRRHDGERVASLHHAVDDLALSRPQRFETEHLA
jgi:hypothetical protein